METEVRQDIYSYVLNEETAYKSLFVPITNSKDWNMAEHVERCTNVANGWFHSGKNDGNRPYTDIVTPIINVALRSEGFDVKDIVPYVNDINENYKSFLVKKFHPQWARKNELDTFIDDLVESSVIYDLALVKNCNDVRPEVVPLQQIAFCDQTDVLSGPLALKHQYSPAEFLEYSGKWNKEMVDLAVLMSKPSKTVSQAGNQEVRTPGKYIEVYEVHGSLPESWLIDGGDPDTYVPQMQIICFYKTKDGKQGITLFKGPEKESIFKTLVINKIHGRACGRSIVETLFEPQVWTNYSGIRIKELLDATAVVLFQTEDEELGDQKLSNLKNNTVLKHSQGKPITKLDTTVPNMGAFTNHQIMLENSARVLGSASDAQLGTNPVSGTPFALQNLIVQQGQGIHEYRQGKIASFVADQLYRDWILGYLVKEMNGGKKFSEELSLDEIQEIAGQIVSNEVEGRIRKQVLETGKVPTNQDREIMKQAHMDEFMKKGNRRFMEILKGDLDEIPVDVYVNIKSKQKNMAQNADKLSNLIMNIMKNPGAVAQIPGVGNLYNELLEESGFSPIDFSKITNQTPQAPQTPQTPQDLQQPAQVGAGQLQPVIPAKA